MAPGVAVSGDWQGADPFSLTTALREAREIRRTAPEPLQEEIRILLGDGYFPIVEPLLLRPEDSGTRQAPTVIAAAPGAKPIITGAVPLTGWQQVRELPEGFPAEES